MLLFRNTAFALLSLLSLTAAAAPAYMRVTEKDGIHTLETAAVKFAPPAAQQATRPAVWVVGVTHVGEASYYRALQTLLNARTITFFEAIRSESGGSQSFYDLAIRSALGLRYFAHRCSAYRLKTGTWPITGDALRALFPEGATAADREALLADAYGTPWRMRVDHEGTLHLSAGSGGMRLKIAPDGRILDPSNALSDVQQTIARALGLTWQLTEISYNYPSFTNVDTSMTDLLASIEKTMTKAGKSKSDLGLEGIATLAILSGGGKEDSWIGTALRLFENACRYTAVRETTRYAMLLACVNFDSLSNQLDAMLPGFNRALLRERNRAVILMLKARLREFGPEDSIALFYGAAHAAGLQQHLIKMGYTPVETHYYPAFSANSAAIPCFRFVDRELRTAFNLPEAD